MTNSPYAAGSAPDPNRPPQSFQYRPQDPGAVPYGQPSGPVLPPPPTWGQRWGLLPKDERPRQVTVILQTLWIHLAAVLTATLLGLTGSLALTLVLGVLAAAVNLVLIWAVAREQLGRFGSDDPKLPVHIGLGVLALLALVRVFNVFTVVPAIVQIAAALLVFVLMLTKPVRAWLAERPGNRPKGSQEPPAPGAPLAPQAPPPQWRDPAAPGLLPGAQPVPGVQPGVQPGASAVPGLLPGVQPGAQPVPGVQPGGPHGYRPPAPPSPPPSGPAAHPGWPQPPR
ncbi:hypothetical protein [Glycomyces terrestris]|uniref:Uncharacterized protein n=1 Tax=Glycomyces terrestris TaxID=2493553 RepID=A0A426V0G9_9ACTN|nr:hypothetical protein [Glycomyces terrestris]RRS00343.1 hypothetical protein EIW28_07115 [Glycomyces terrestris]